MAFLNEQQLKDLGLKSLGKNVMISEKASLYGCQNMEIGDFTRVDDFAILSAGAGGIKLGRYVHVACYASVIGRGRIELGDFSGISSRVSIYSSNDDYSGRFMTNPIVSAKYTNITHGPVTLGKHVIVGAGTIILPNVTLGDGSAVGALSLVNRSCEPFKIYSGIPAEFVKNRERTLMDMEQQFLREVEEQ